MKIDKNLQETRTQRRKKMLKENENDAKCEEKKVVKIDFNSFVECNVD